MSEPLIIEHQREVVRSIKRLAEQHIEDEADAEARLKLDREAAEQAFAKEREAADAELHRALSMLHEASQLIQPGGEKADLNELTPLAPPKLFETDLLIGMRIATAQMETLLLRIKASFQDTTSSALITAGIVVGVVIAIGAILLMPFMSSLGATAGGWSYGWFAAMVSPLVLALVVAGVRTTILRPYSPDADYDLIRQNMAHILYMHQVLVEEARGTFERRLTERQERCDETKERIAQSFRQQLGMLEPLITKFSASAFETSPEWDSPTWDTWEPAHEKPHTICVGELLAGIHDDRLSLPAMVPFPHEQALVIKTEAQARDRAIAAIQSIMLRLVATTPPGDLQFILIDPRDGGRNFSSFMPFADAVFGLGEGRAWTDPLQIEQRLWDLVNLVEGAADAQAFHTLLPRLDSRRPGGMTEPCRVLVVLDFPTNFNGATARMLWSLAAKGPEHGVHLILMVDNDQSVPFGFNLSELEQAATTLIWDGRRFVWQDSDFRSCWIELDRPPRSQLARKLLSSGHEPVVAATTP
jgi:hypothetical protein